MKTLADFTRGRILEHMRELRGISKWRLSSISASYDRGQESIVAIVNGEYSDGSPASTQYINLGTPGELLADFLHSELVGLFGLSESTK